MGILEELMHLSMGKVSNTDSAVVERMMIPFGPSFSISSLVLSSQRYEGVFVPQDGYGYR